MSTFPQAIPRVNRPRLTHQQLQNLFRGSLLVVISIWVLRMMFSPDPAAALFARAERLEAVGQSEEALRRYALLASHPESPYAARALQREGNILAGLARRGGDARLFGLAIATYRTLADNYPVDPLAGDALLTAGSISLDDLHDTRGATAIFKAVLERYPNNMDFVSEATLRLGLIALADGQGLVAQGYLQQVLQKYTRFTDRCAEAQYHLGVAYETLFHNHDWASRAYEAVVKRYPESVWADDAKRQLGMLFYARTGQPQVRRVLIAVSPSGSVGGHGGSMLDALRPLLAARSLEADATALDGWSLHPFFAGYVPGDAGRVVVLGANEQFENVTADAGLRYSVTSSVDDKLSLKALQGELDAGRTPVAFYRHWVLVVGYDTARDEVMVQADGAHYDTLPVKTFLEGWKKESPLGSAFTMVTFAAPGDKPQAAVPSSAPADNGQPPSLGPTATPAVPVPDVPSFFLEMKPLAVSSVNRRTVGRALALMRRPHSDRGLLNIAALDALASTLKQVSAAPSQVVGAELQDNLDPALEGPARHEGAAAAIAPSPGVTVASAAVQANALRSILPWFGRPLARWVGARQDAAAYLEGASRSFGGSSLLRAAQALQQSAVELQEAANAVPAAGVAGPSVPDAMRPGLAAAAAHVAAARDAEKRAAQAMADALG